VFFRRPRTPAGYHGKAKRKVRSKKREEQEKS